jgi:ornithine carbamoyltransferase
MNKRDFLSLHDLSLGEARDVFARTARMKQSNKAAATSLLAGRAIAVVLEKSSTRTRVSFEVGISQLGAHPVTITTEGSQIARGEPIKDTARVLSGYCDLIAFRTFTTRRLREMASFAKVPVINALSDDGHPVQVLCDVFTIEEAFGRSIAGMRVAFVGDCSSNMARSWVEAARLFDFHLCLAAPDGYFPPDHELRAAGERVSTFGDAREAVKGCDVVNTDVWASMGQEAEAEKRRNDFAGPWTVDAGMMEGAKAGAIVLHCLPAHRGEEIDDAVMEGPQSRIFEQAENRLHVQKGLMCFLLGVHP